MAPSQKLFPFNSSVRKRTEAPRRHGPSVSPPHKKYGSLKKIMENTFSVELDVDCYSDTACQKCGSGEGAQEMLLCDKCDKGFHIYCLRPIVFRVPIGSWFCPSCSDQTQATRVIRLQQKKIVDFFRIQKCPIVQEKCTSLLDGRKRKRRSGMLVMQKKRRRLLPFTPAENRARRLEQMATLAKALMGLHMEFSNDLTYMPGMAPRSANQAKLELGGMQGLPKEDVETLEHCRAMCKRGDCPPLLVVFDPCEGFTVEADSQIKDMTLITEYTGNVDYIKNRELDDCDSMMTLLLARNPCDSLVICPDKRGNIARFINGINNHTPEGKKKQNLKCVRYNVKGECRVLLVAIRDIAKGERLYYDYNGYEHEYPTHYFV